MDISLYFEPINEDIVRFKPKQFAHSAYGHQMSINRKNGSFPILEGAEIALIGVSEDREALENKGCGKAADYIRSRFYQLFSWQSNTNIIDLGNLRNGENVKDTYFAIEEVMSSLLEHDIVPIIIGGSNDMVFAMYKAYERIKRVVNIVSVDARFDIGSEDAPIDSQAYLSKIIMQQPNYLFNYTNIGYQSYFVDPELVQLMGNLYFDTYRLGVVRSDMKEVEPIVRNADMLSIDASAIRHADFQGNYYSSPNGFSCDEICMITRYAGISDKLSAIGFFEYNPMLDNNLQSAHLIAQMIWYFIDGFYQRKKDSPQFSKEMFVKYMVSIQDGLYEINFYKSKKSERWWMEVPYPPSQKARYERHNIIPCSHKDYEIACNDEVPDRWWQAMKKMV